MLYLLYLFVWTVIALLGGFGLVATAIWLTGFICIVVREFFFTACGMVQQIAQQRIVQEEKPLPKPTNPKGLDVERDFLK